MNARQKKAIIAEYESGQSIRMIAHSHGVTTGKVTDTLLGSGVQMRPSNKPIERPKVIGIERETIGRWIEMLRDNELDALRKELLLQYAEGVEFEQPLTDEQRANAMQMLIAHGACV